MKAQDRRAAYRATVFAMPEGAAPPGWLAGPGPFAALSARNPGRLLEDSENEARHEELRLRLVRSGHEHAEIIGRAPDGSHCELGWALRCSPAEAVALGRAFGQEAVFLVEGGRVSLAPCRDDREVEALDDWAARFAALTPRCVLHVPHSSLEIPADVAGELSLPSEQLEPELALMTDHFTDELFAPPGPGFVQVRFPVSRLVVDPERFLDDALEPMAGRGHGVIYERTADGRPLRPRPTAARREELLERYYRPHHARLTAAVEAALAAHGRALIVDAHSFPDRPLPCDLDAMEERPDICLGTDAFHTPSWLTQALREECRALGWSVEVDRPYAGAMVPASVHGRDARVTSIMIEVNRRLYLTTDGPRRGPRFSATKAGVQQLLAAAAAALGSEKGV